MKQLKYIGEHQPKGMIVEVVDTEAEGLLATGEYEELGKSKPIVTKEIEEKEEDDNSKRASSRY